MDPNQPPAAGRGRLHPSHGLAGLGLALTLTAIWVAYAVLDPTPYWQEVGDYTWYSLSQALTLEALAQRWHAHNIGFNIHPGLPFGIASWLSLRLSVLGLPSSSARIVFALDNAEQFWLVAKTFALILNLFAILAFWTWMTRRALVLWTGVAVYFAMVPAAFTSGLLQLTNESFTFLVIVCSYAAIDRFYCADPTPRSRRWIPSVRVSDRDLMACLLGVVAAFGCTIKMYYVAPAVGFAGSVAVAAAVGLMGWRDFWRAGLFAVLGFLAIGGLLVWFTMGGTGIRAWLSWNWNMFLHVDRYGTGQQGVASLSGMAAAFSNLGTSTGWRFPFLLGALTLAAVVVVARGVRSADWRRQHLGFSIALFTGAAICLFGLLKHYSPLSLHYALPLCATISCVVVLISRQASADGFMRLTGIAATVALAMNVIAYHQIHTQSNAQAARVLVDEAVINSLPLATGEKRVWVYFSPTRAGVAPLIVQYAGSPFISQILADVRRGPDIPPNADPEAAQWRYVIFPKSYFPTVQAIRDRYRQHFDIALTRFKIRESDVITELDTFFVLSRATQ